MIVSGPVGHAVSRRLRAIGNHFEAEDEAQQGPEPRAAIREARKTYQANGAMPPCDTLADKKDSGHKTLLPL